MLLHIANTIFVVLTVLSLGASATALETDLSKSITSSLEARQGLCCVLAQDNRWIQPVCQYMYENCGGWSDCLTEGEYNDIAWCDYCVVKHPEDPVCTTATWPPVHKAPSKRSLDDSKISLTDDVDEVKDERFA